MSAHNNGLCNSLLNARAGPSERRSVRCPIGMTMCSAGVIGCMESDHSFRYKCFGHGTWNCLVRPECYAYSNEDLADLCRLKEQRIKVNLINYKKPARLTIFELKTTKLFIEWKVWQVENTDEFYR